MELAVNQLRKKKKVDLLFPYSENKNNNNYNNNNNKEKCDTGKQQL